jgi:hypothetical protein
MAMTLRLDEVESAAVVGEARRTGRSQNEVIRAAVRTALHLPPVGGQPVSDDLDRLVASGTVRPPRRAYRRSRPTLRLPASVTSADLLAREDGI